MKSLVARLKLKQAISLPLMILVLSMTNASGTANGQVNSSTDLKVDLISAVSNKLMYDAGEDVRISLVLSNKGTSPLLNATLTAIVTIQNSLASAQRIPIASNIYLKPLEENVLKDLTLWQAPTNKNSRIYNVALELKDSSGKTLVFKPNMMIFKVKGIKLLDDEIPPIVTVKYQVSQLKAKDKVTGKVTLLIDASDESSISKVILYFDKNKTNTWNPRGISFSANQTISKLTPGMHYYRVEVYDSSNVSIIQDSIFIPESPAKCPTNNRAKYVPCTPPLQPKPVTLNIKTMPAFQMINVRVSDIDFFTGSDGTVSIKLMPGSHIVEIVNDVVKISELEKLVFKIWDAEFRTFPGQKKIEVAIPIDQADMQSIISITAKFDRQYRMEFTTSGLPDGAKVKLKVDAPDYFKSWSYDSKTPLNFVIQDWLDPTEVRFSIEPTRVDFAGVTYSFSHWEYEDGRILSYMPNDKITLRPLKLIAVYKQFSSSQTQLLNLSPQNATQLGSVPIDFVASFRASVIKDAIVHFHLDDKLIGAARTDERGYASLTLRNKLTEGMHKWYVTAKDTLGNEVRSAAWTFNYRDNKNAEIGSADINEQSLAPGQILLLDLTMNVLDKKALGTLKVKSSIYDVDDNIIASNLIYQAPLRKSTQLKLDDLHLWEIPASSKSGTYSVLLQLIDANGIIQDSKLLKFEVTPNTKILNYNIDLFSWNSVKFDISKSSDDDSDKKKDAYVHINLPFEASKLSVLMNVEPDDNIDMLLFSPDGKMAANSTKGKGIAEQIDISNPEKGEWKLHVSASSIAGSTALVNIEFNVVKNDQLKIISTNAASGNYTSGERASIITKIRNLDNSIKKIGIRYEIVDDDGILKKVQYSKAAIKADSEKTVRKFLTLDKDLAPGTYYIIVSVYDARNSENYDFGQTKLSILPIPKDTIQVKIQHSHIGDLDVSLGIFGGKEVLIKSHDANDDSTNLAITKDLLELGITDSEPKSLIYLKVRDNVNGNEGAISYVSLSFNGKFSESFDKVPIRDLSITIVPLFELDSMIYLRSQAQNENELALPYISLDDSKERPLSKLLYQRVFQNLLVLNATSNLSLKPCVLMSSDPLPVLCLSGTGGKYTLSKQIVGKALDVANDLDAHVFALLEPSFLEYVNHELPYNGLVIVSSDDISYDLYFNGNLVDHALLPEYFDVLRGEARLGNLINGIETLDAIERMGIAVSNYLDSNPKNVKTVAEFLGKGISKNTISHLLESLSKMLNKDVANQMKKWIEYYRALQVIEELKAMGLKFNQPRDVALAYAMDYIDRYPNVAKLVVPNGFDQVLSNVQISDNSTKKSYLDLVYVKQGKVVSIIKVDSEQKLTSSILKQDLSKIFKDLVTDKGSRIASISHGLKVTQFDKLSDKQLLALGTANGDAEFNIRLPLTSSEIKQIFNQTK